MTQRLSLAIAFLALLVAASTTSYAAGVARNSVGTQQLKKNAVATAKIKNNAVATPKLRNGAVTGAKVRDRSIARADLAPGIVPAAPRSAVGTLAGGESRSLAAVGGVRLTVSCVASGPSGATAGLEIDPAVDGHQLTGLYVITKQLESDSGSTVYTSGAGYPIYGLSVSASTTSFNRSHGVVTGHLRMDDGAPALLDLAFTARGGGAPQCYYDLLLTPTG